VRSIGLIGCGNWGRHHARTLYELGYLGAVSDLSLPRTREILNELQIDLGLIQLYANYRQLLDDATVSAVVIATSAETHFDLALAALKAGKDVLVEKPLCLSRQEGDVLVNTAKGLGRILQVGHLLEYHGAYVKMHEILGQESALGIGSIIHIEASLKKLGRVREKEDVLWSFGPHLIASILAFLQSMPVHVEKWVGDRDRIRCRLVFDACSDAVLTHRTDAVIDLSWRHPVREQVFTIHGTVGTLQYDGVSGILIYHNTQIDPQTGYQKVLCDGGSGVQIDYDNTPPLRVQLLAFADAIKTRQAPKANGEAGLKVIQVLQQLSDLPSITYRAFRKS